jgi:hypothetical protein
MNQPNRGTVRLTLSPGADQPLPRRTDREGTLTVLNNGQGSYTLILTGLYGETWHIIARGDRPRLTINPMSLGVSDPSGPGVLHVESGFLNLDNGVLELTGFTGGVSSRFACEFIPH